MRSSLRQKLPITRTQAYLAMVVLAVLTIALLQLIPREQLWLLRVAVLVGYVGLGFPELWSHVGEMRKAASHSATPLRYRVGLTCSLIGFPLLGLGLLAGVGIGPFREDFLGGVEVQSCVMLAGALLSIVGWLLEPVQPCDDAAANPSSSDDN